MRTDQDRMPTRKKSKQKSLSKSEKKKKGSVLKQRGLQNSSSSFAECNESSTSALPTSAPDIAVELDQNSSSGWESASDNDNLFPQITEECLPHQSLPCDLLELQIPMRKEEQVVIQGSLICGGMNYAESVDELIEMCMQSPTLPCALSNHSTMQNPVLQHQGEEIQVCQLVLHEEMS